MDTASCPGWLSEKRKRKADPRSASKEGGRATSRGGLGGSLQSLRVRVNAKLRRRPAREIAWPYLGDYGLPRFRSSFKMTDSAISRIDLRLCWLSLWSAR